MRVVNPAILLSQCTSPSCAISAVFRMLDNTIQNSLMVGRLFSRIFFYGAGLITYGISQGKHPWSA